MLTEKSKKAENLLKEYIELREKTKLEVHDIGLGGKISDHIKTLNLEDIKREAEARDNLYSCLDELSDESLQDLFSDDHFMENAIRILAQRSKSQS